jgi:flavin reductase
MHHATVVRCPGAEGDLVTYDVWTATMPTTSTATADQNASRDIAPVTSASTPGPATVGDGLRSAMRLFPTGVALLSTGQDSEAVAMTVNSLMSVSLSPPQVLVGVAHTARAHPVLASTRSFTLHLLSARQSETATLFASSRKPSGPALAAHLRSNVVPGTLASLSCAVVDTYPGGDHSLFLGGVEAVAPGDIEEQPLVFHHGALTGSGAHG